MFNMEYKKINLRDFRKNLTQIRDSGNAYTVFKKGVPFAYFTPSEYEITVTKKNVSKKKFSEILDSMTNHRVEFKDEVKDEKSYKEAYRKLLEKKYLKNE